MAKCASKMFMNLYTNYLYINTSFQNSYIYLLLSETRKEVISVRMQIHFFVEYIMTYLHTCRTSNHMRHSLLLYDRIFIFRQTLEI